MPPCWPMTLARTPLSHRPTHPLAALRAASASRPAGTAPSSGGAPACGRLADQLLDCIATLATKYSPRTGQQVHALDECAGRGIHNAHGCRSAGPYSSHEVDCNIFLVVCNNF